MSGFKYIWVLNIPGFQNARVLDSQGYTGYSFFHKYGRIFWICAGMKLRRDSECSMNLNMSVSAYEKLTPGSGFVWIWMNYAWINCSDYGKVLNMAAQRFTSVWICLDAEYGKVVNMPRQHRVLNMPE